MDATVETVSVELGGGLPGAVASSRPRLSWTVTTDAPDWVQGRAEIELDDEKIARVTGRASVLVEWPFEPIVPHARHRVRVRVAADDDGYGPWSSPIAIDAAFLADGEWVAEFIGLPSPRYDAQPFRVRRSFRMKAGLVRATLFGAALGVYQAHINGHDVDDQVLKPGWTPYRRRIVHESTDVTALMRPGKANVIGADVAGGWFTERYFLPQARYGAQPAVALQLRLEYDDGSVNWIATDNEWRADPASPVFESSIYDGEHYDARREVLGWATTKFDAAGWQPSSAP